MILKNRFCSVLHCYFLIIRLPLVDAIDNVSAKKVRSRSIELPISSTSSTAADVSWEFSHGLEGWAYATSNEMQAEVYHMGDEMWMDIEGPMAHIDSPLFMNMIGSEDAGSEDEKLSIVFRYRYIGVARGGKLKLRGRRRGDSMDSAVTDHGFVDWGENSEMNNEDGFMDVDFKIQNDGQWHIAYAHVNKLAQHMNQGVTQIRLWPALLDKDDTNSDHQYRQEAAASSSFHIDWIRILRGGPVIRRVTGCNGEKYSHNESFHGIHHIVETQHSKVNNILKHQRTIWKQDILKSESGYESEYSTSSYKYKYASTYNCLRSGGENITIEGLNFGGGGINGMGVPAHVYIDKKPCAYVQHDAHVPQQRLTCITPPMNMIGNQNNEDGRVYTQASLIEVKNGKLPGLIGISSWFGEFLLYLFCFVCNRGP